MDHCRPNPQTFAVRKAYTSAMSGQDSVAYAERLKSQGRSVSDMGNPNLVAAQGAVVVLHPQSGAVLGAIGVSGLTAQEDEDLARSGLAVPGALAWVGRNGRFVGHHPNMGHRACHGCRPCTGGLCLHQR